MKALYESILDDEDVLMNDVKNHSNNPFRALKHYYDDPETRKQWKIYADEIISNLKLPKGISYEIMDGFISFKLSKTSDTIFDLIFKDDSMQYSVKDRASCLLVDNTKSFFDGRKFGPNVRKWVEVFKNKYDFKNHERSRVWSYLEK
jgi:hypothetical protein